MIIVQQKKRDEKSIKNFLTFIQSMLKDIKCLSYVCEKQLFSESEPVLRIFC